MVPVSSPADLPVNEATPVAQVEKDRVSAYSSIRCTEMWRAVESLCIDGAAPSLDLKTNARYKISAMFAQHVLIFWQ